MANRKKYVAKLIKLENIRKKRLTKRLKRAKKLMGRLKAQKKVKSSKEKTAAVSK